MVGTIDEKEEIIMNCGAFGYDYKIVASLLNEDEKQVQIKMELDKEYHKIYVRGRNFAKYKLDNRLLQMACSGDINAIRQFSNMKEINKK